MAKSNAKRSPEVDRADREPVVRAARTPARAGAPGPRATPKPAESVPADDKRSSPQPVRAASTNRSDSPAASRDGERTGGGREGAGRENSGRENNSRAAGGRQGSPAAAGRDNAGRGTVAATSPPEAQPSRRTLDAAEAVRMEKADIGIASEQRAGVSRILNKALSDEHVLYVRTRNYHWNVTGMHFRSLHEFFEEQYKALESAIDEIAERTRSLGFRAIGSMREFLQHARLPEQAPAEVPDAVGMLRNLLADHEAIIKYLRADVDACDDEFDDVGTADFLTGMMEAHEKMAWMIRAFLS